MSSFLASIKKNKIGLILIIIAALFTSLGQMLWKLSGGSLDWTLFLGFMFYFLGAVFMIVAFRFGSLSVIHPVLSIGYIFAIFFGLFFLNETLSIKECVGIIIIVIGATLIGGGDH